MGLHVNSIVNEAIKTIWQHKEHKKNKAQLTKQKQVNKKQLKQQFFVDKGFVRKEKLFILRFFSI